MSEERRDLIPENNSGGGEGANIATFDLRGLKLVFRAFVITVVCQVVNLGMTFSGAAAEGGASGLGTAASILSIIGLVMFIVGLGRISPYSENYAGARKYMIRCIIVSIVGVLAGSFVLVAAPAIGILVLLIVAVALIYMQLKAFKLTLFGCSDIANKAGDPGSADTYKAFWKQYLVMFFVSIGIVFVGAMGVSMQAAGDLAGTQDAASIAQTMNIMGNYLVPFGIVVLAGGALMIYVNLKYAMTILKAYNSYEGKPFRITTDAF